MILVMETGAWRKLTGQEPNVLLPKRGMFCQTFWTLFANSALQIRSECIIFYLCFVPERSICSIADAAKLKKPNHKNKYTKMQDFQRWLKSRDDVFCSASMWKRKCVSELWLDSEIWDCCCWCCWHRAIMFRHFLCRLTRPQGAMGAITGVSTMSWWDKRKSICFQESYKTQLLPQCVT